MLALGSEGTSLRAFAAKQEELGPIHFKDESLDRIVYVDAFTYTASNEETEEQRLLEKLSKAIVILPESLEPSHDEGGSSNYDPANGPNIDIRLLYISEEERRQLRFEENNNSVKLTIAGKDSNSEEKNAGIEFYDALTNEDQSDAKSVLLGIRDSAFENCVGMTGISIADSVTSIGNSAFENCSSLENVTLPDSVMAIGEGAFENCSSLKSIKIPDGVTSIEDEAFKGCSSLISVEIPDSVTSIGDEAFKDCSSLASVEIPDSVASIGNEAFKGCSSLTSVEIPDSVVSIGNEAFRDCSNLANIKIPDGEIKIGVNAFLGCGNQKDTATSGDVFQVVTYENTSTPASSHIQASYHSHTIVDVGATMPTCTEVGYTAGQRCSECGAVLVKQEKIPALGHTEVIDAGGQ